MPGEHWAPRTAKTRATIIELVERSWFDRERGPSRSELAAELGISKSAVNQHVAALIAEGQLEQPPGVRQSLRVAL